jgi:acetyl esterase/lipase
MLRNSQIRIYIACVFAASLAALVSISQAQQPDFPDLQWATVPTDAGGTQPLRMNIWLADSGVDRAPLVIWIHGGGWQGGTYDNLPQGLQALLDNGYAVASIQYRLSGAAIFPAQIHDVKGAVRYLRSHADEFALDASRFAAFGSSAGGHLTTLLATSGGVAELEGTTGGNLDESSTIQTAIDYFGPTDIVNMTLDIATPPGGASHDAPTSPESKLIGFSDPGEGIGVLRENLTNPASPFPEKAALATLINPITHLDANDPPIFIAHGDQDTTVPFKQSQRLADALEAVDIEHVFRTVVGAGHGFGAQSGVVNDEAIEFLNGQLLQPAGDFDRDGDVDGRDFLKWQRDSGANVNPKGSGADANHDGTVNDEDLGIWQQHYGEGSQSISMMPIPEPSTAVLILYAACGLARRPGEPPTIRNTVAGGA